MGTISGATMSQAGQPRLKFADWLRPAQLAPILARHGRLHMAGVLDPAAAPAVARALEAAPWTNTVIVGGKHYDAPAARLEAAPEAMLRAAQAQLDECARAGFAYAFDTWRVGLEIEAGRRSGGALAPVEAVYDLLNSAAGLDFLRRLTGDPRVAYCDAQATRYRAGHFLNVHHDDVEGTHRLFAYVLNLTPVWRLDWGGLLLFHDADGHVAEGYAPKFNALNIFRVPQAHSVSQVASFARASRLSVTGWLCTAEAKPRPQRREIPA